MTATYKTSAKNVRVSVRKMKPVIDLVRYRTVEDACTILKHSNRRAGRQLSKILTSSRQSIKHNYRVVEPLSIAEIFATKGRTTRRAFRQSRLRKNLSSHKPWPRRAGVCHVYVKLTPTLFVKKGQPKLKQRRQLNLHYQRRQLLANIIKGLINSKN